MHRLKIFEKKNKRGESIAAWAIIAVAAVAIWYMLAGPGAQQPTAPVSGGGVGGGGIIDVCSNPSVTATYGPISAWQQPTVSIGATINATVWRYKASAPNYQGPIVYTSGGTSTVDGRSSDPDVLEIVYGIGEGSSTSDTAPLNGYWSSYAKLNVPCSTFQTKDEQGTKGTADLVQNGTADFAIYASDQPGSEANGGQQNESIGAADTGKWTIKYSTAAYTGWNPITPGRPNSKVRLMVEYNGTTFDRSLISLNGKAPDNFQKPTYYSLNSLVSEVAGWTFPGCPDASGSKNRCDEDYGVLSLTSKTGQDPSIPAATCDPLGGGGIKVCLMPESWYKNTVTGKPEYGFENNLGGRPTNLREQCTTLCIT